MFGVRPMVSVIALWFHVVLLTQGAVLDEKVFTATLETTLIDQFGMGSGLGLTPKSSALIFCIWSSWKA